MRLFTHHRRMARLLALATFYVLFSFAHVQADNDKVVIKVMTQNQYLGADLSQILTAGNDPVLFNQALIDVLNDIGNSNYPERVLSLAETIADSNSDLIGLQEIWAFGCTPTPFSSVTDPCNYFGPAFNDHLEATMDALADLGADYYVAARVQNLTVDPVLIPIFPVPGIPVDIDFNGLPDILVTVKDRDAILARGDIVTEVVDYDCAKESLEGCNFETVAALPPLDINGISFQIKIERGFVAVDATIRGEPIRFVDTHFEVRFPNPADLTSRVVQSVQASELLGWLAAYPPPAGTRLIVVGDINSDPDDPYPRPASGPFLTPYQQFVSGRDYLDAQISQAYNDVWTLKKKQKPGLTCCEAGDLLNPKSIHDRRVDMIFSLDEPDKVKARTLNTRKKDKTPSGLWPSDHATVVARLRFDEDDDDDDDDDDDNDDDDENDEDDD